jgi:uncharacterized membrane protein
VLCNGYSEDYNIKSTGKNKDIYIGKPDVYLTPGIYEYTITYESVRQVGFFDEYDELYWNVIGNDWGFYIEKASAYITLPKDAQSISTSCYTGYFGSTEMKCSAKESENVVFFETDDLLGAHEGFTVAVSFSRDIIKRPTERELFLRKHQNLITALICLLIFGLFFYFTWRKVGRGPEKRLAIPDFKPPYGWSPATIRYLYKRTCDHKAFAAALVNMAVKKAIRISNKNDQYILEAIERKDHLSEEEKEIYDTLFNAENGIGVKQKHYKIFSSANRKLLKSLSTNWKIEDYFQHNPKYVAYGAVLTSILIGLVIFITGLTNSETDSSIETWVPSIFIPIMFIFYITYIYSIRAPTKLGAQTATEIKGFKMYLKAVEEHRLNLLTPPKRTPELFENLLPYAIALGVHNKWGEKFTDILKQFNYNPDWYISDTPFVPSIFASNFAQSFSASVGSSYGYSGNSSGGSWSSGSGGGGFSGGGGGGGGGGGW